MGWIGTIVVGFIVGLIARFLMPGKDAMGFILTTILGIAGSVLATFVGQQAGWYQPGELTGWIGSIVGAIILLFIYNMVTKRR